MSSAKFLEGPFEFAKTNAVVPQLGTEPEDKLKPKKVDANLTVYQVKGGNRILFANIVQNVSAYRCYEVEFNAAQLSSSWFSGVLVTVAVQQDVSHHAEAEPEAHGDRSQ
jgi:hypothetical protein